MCIRDISIWPVSMIFQSDFGIIPAVWHFMFFILFGAAKAVYYMSEELMWNKRFIYILFCNCCRSVFDFEMCWLFYKSINNLTIIVLIIPLLWRASFSSLVVNQAWEISEFSRAFLLPDATWDVIVSPAHDVITGLLDAYVKSKFIFVILLVS